MATEFVPRPGFDAELNDMPGVVDARLRVAAGIAQEAERIAPELSGHYKRSLKAIKSGRTVRVLTDDRAGHLVEYGSINNEAHAPLRTAAAKAGHFVEKSKGG